MSDITTTARSTDQTFNLFTLHKSATIREAFKKHDFNDQDFILVQDDEENIVGIVTSGDFHQAIWNAVSLEEPVELIMNREFIYLEEKGDLTKARDIFTKRNIKQIPVLDNGKLIDIIFREKVGISRKSKKILKIKLPVVIMAGGLGTRLDPFTRILPKPLIPIGEKPIIELIMERFMKSGVDEFYISLNHKARMVKAFFEETKQICKINFIEENKPLGTVGSLNFLKGKVDSPFMVSNCDILIETDYNQIFEFHKAGSYGLTMVGSTQHHVIPYGVCHTQNDGELKNLDEKPHFDFLVNTGMYIMEPKILELIPKNRNFDITDLIGKLREKGERIGVFPISDKSWVDIGQWENYKATIQKLSSIFLEEE